MLLERGFQAMMMREFDEKRNAAKFYNLVEVTDKETGEVIQEAVYDRTIYYGEESFFRLHGWAFYEGMWLLSKSGIMLMMFLVLNADRKTNVVHLTQTKMAKESRIPLKTIEKEIPKLEALDYIRCGGHGDWMVNPFIEYKYYDKERENVAKRYNTYPTYREKQQVRLLRKEQKESASG